MLEANVKGFETPNDVLRRMLQLNPGTEQQQGVTRGPGALKPLIDAGVVRAGDKLYHRQVRKRLTHEMEVLEDGWIRAGGVPFRTPSRALGSVVGSSIDGWAYSVHEGRQMTLRALAGEAGVPRPSRGE